MEKVKKQARTWLLIGIAVMLVCCIMVSLIQTDFGRVTMKELSVETDAGYNMSAYLFIPDGATAENPAPGIVTSHGFLNNKEMQDANYVELARRGYAVLAVDQPCHGDSEVIKGDTDGVYQGALVLSRLPFVDKAKIGITGHSMGGGSCNSAIRADNENEEPLIAAVLLNCADAMYQDEDGNFFNAYGSRDVGIVSAVYDEFFHMYNDENGVLREAPYFMGHETAQSFLNFGKNPEGLEKREAFVTYHEDIDGEDAIRVIYRPEIIHPWSHFSARSTAGVIDFFENSLGAPRPAAPDKQIWQWKEACNFIGLLGLCIFICAFGTLMLYTRPFECLRAKAVAEPVKVEDKSGKRWFWFSMLFSVLFSLIIFLPACLIGALCGYVAQISSQMESLGIGLWSTFCGVFCILSMHLFYRKYGKKHNMDLEERGVKMSGRKLGLSILLGFIIFLAAYACIFAADYFFFADFRIWTLALKAFELPILKRLPYVLLFVTFYIVNSVSVNCFNYNNIGGKSWGNTLLVSFLTALPAIILPAVQYIHYFTAKSMLLGGPFAMPVLWLFPIILVLFISTVISRVIYKVSKNPYIAGTANALIIGLMTITNTCTVMF